jgi:hypothetical protein
MHMSQNSNGVPTTKFGYPTPGGATLQWEDPDLGKVFAHEEGKWTVVCPTFNQPYDKVRVARLAPLCGVSVIAWMTRALVHDENAEFLRHDA